MPTSNYNNTGLSTGEAFERHEIEKLASDLVQLHFGIHTILYKQPLAFLECLVCELRRWSLPDDAAVVMATMLPEVDDKTFRTVLALTTPESGAMARF